MVEFLNRYNKWSKSLNAIDREPYIQAAEKKTIHCAGFRDCLYTGFTQDGALELKKYLTGTDIVKDLNEHFKKFQIFI